MVEWLGEGEVNHPVVEDRLGHELAQELELVLHLESTEHDKHFSSGFLWNRGALPKGQFRLFLLLISSLLSTYEFQRNCFTLVFAFQHVPVTHGEYI